MARHAQSYALRKPQGSAVWHVRFTHEKTRFDESTGERNKKPAQEAAARIYAAVTSGRWQPGVTLSSPTTPLFEVAADWLAFVSSQADKGTVKVYGYYVTAHWQAFFKTVDQITKSRATAYIAQRLGKVRRKTVQKELSALRGFVAWCYENNHMTELPEIPTPARKALGTADTKRRHKLRAVELSKADVEAVIANLPEWSGERSTRFAVRARFIVAYETGLRPATLDKLKGTDLIGGKLAIRDETDKARFGRDLPLTPRARFELEKLANGSGLIFGTHQYREHLDKAAVLAGLHGVTPYDFRHAFGTHRTEDSGGNLVGVAFLMGHLQVTTTNKYVKPNQKAAERVLGILGQSGAESNSESSETVRKKGLEPSRDVISLEPEPNNYIDNSREILKKHAEKCVPENGLIRHSDSFSGAVSRYPHREVFKLQTADGCPRCSAQLGSLRWSGRVASELAPVSVGLLGYVAASVLKGDASSRLLGAK